MKLEGCMASSQFIPQRNTWTSQNEAPNVQGEARPSGGSVGVVVLRFTRGREVVFSSVRPRRRFVQAKAHARVEKTRTKQY